MSRQEESQGCSPMGHSGVVGYLHSSATVGHMSPVGRTGWEGRRSCSVGKQQRCMELCAAVSDVPAESCGARIAGGQCGQYCGGCLICTT